MKVLILALLIFIWLPACASEAQPLRVCIAGDNVVFHGETHAAGFVSLIDQHLPMEHLPILTFSSFHGDTETALSLFETQYREAFDLVILFPFTDEIIEGERSTDRLKIKLQLFVQGILDRTSRLVISTPLLFGEHYNEELDEMFEEVSALCSLTAQRFKLEFFDIRSAIVKYLEHKNTDSLFSSILTYDGYHLNGLGHEFVAEFTIFSLGLTNDEVFKFHASDHLYSPPASRGTNPNFFVHELDFEALGIDQSHPAFQLRQEMQQGQQEQLEGQEGEDGFQDKPFSFFEEEF